MDFNLRRFPNLRAVVLEGIGAYWRLRERYLQNYLFIHINKTGGRSIETALGCIYEHKTALQKRCEVGGDVWRKKFTFAFVRNPWDRVVSQYFFRLETRQDGIFENDISFEDWVRLVYQERSQAYLTHRNLFIPQSAWVTDEDGHQIIDFVGRFEQIETDFERVADRIGFDGDLPHKNESSRNHYRDYHTDETKKIVSRFFEEDIKRFGYKY
jgi:hypothetical protein